MIGNYIDFERPPVLRGTPEQNIDALYRYLQRLSGQLTDEINASGYNEDPSTLLKADDLKTAIQELKDVSNRMMACMQTMSKIADKMQQGNTESNADASKEVEK